MITRFIFIFLLFAGCNRNHNQYVQLEPLKDPIKKYELFIDSLSSYKILYPQYILDGSSEKLATLNYNLNRLDFYDLGAGKAEYTITYDPNLDFRKISGYTFFNKDSIFLINEFNELLLTDYKGEILKKSNMKNVDVPGKPHIVPGYLDVVITSNSVEIANYYVAESHVPTKLSLVDWDNGSLIARGSMPNEYVEGYHGIFEYLYWTYQKVGVFYYVNWPSLSSIYKYDLNWNLTEIIDLSQEDRKSNRLIFKKGLKSEDLKQKPSVSEMLDISSNYVSNFVFVNLLFNPFSDEFYRIVGYPIEGGVIDIFQSGPANIERNYSLIVYDKDLNFKKEFAIPDGKYLIKYGSYFVTKDGLAIQRESEVNDDLAIFDVFGF